jgi:hypothetical protein
MPRTEPKRVNYGESDVVTGHVIATTRISQTYNGKIFSNHLYAHPLNDFASEHTHKASIRRRKSDKRTVSPLAHVILTEPLLARRQQPRAHQPQVLPHRL